MWTFLGTEVMFFGGLIVSYIVYRFTSPDVWGAASKYGLNVKLGTINTVVLLTSSLAMAMAVHAGETGDRKHQLRYLLLTLGLGLAVHGDQGVRVLRGIRTSTSSPAPRSAPTASHLPDEPRPPPAPSRARGRGGRDGADGVVPDGHARPVRPAAGAAVLRLLLLHDRACTCSTWSSASAW